MARDRDALKEANRLAIKASVAAGNERETVENKRLSMSVKYAYLDLPSESSDEAWLGNQVIAAEMGQDNRMVDHDFTRDLLLRVSILGTQP